MFSTGEYPFTTRIAESSFAKCDTDAASPPVITCRTPANAAGYSSIMKLSRLADKCTVVISCVTISSAITAGSGRDPGCNTHVAPCNNGPNSSNANASHDRGEHCNQTPLKS